MHAFTVVSQMRTIHTQAHMHPHKCAWAWTCAHQAREFATVVGSETKGRAEGGRAAKERPDEADVAGVVAWGRS